MAARFELCECGCCSGAIVLANGFSGLQVCSKEEARLSVEAARLQDRITAAEFESLLVSIEDSTLPERLRDVAGYIRIEALCDNLSALGHSHGPVFGWEEDLLEENVRLMLQEDAFCVQDIGAN